MKCQNCSETATFHITELTGDDPVVLHLCAECARTYLSAADEPKSETKSGLAEHLSGQFSLSQSEEELSQIICPVCGISFQEFRADGRLGCPHDYVVFERELEPLLLNVHGAKEHNGKTPRRWPNDTDERTELIKLRREMLEAVDEEDYERASKIRDRIRQLSDFGRTEEDA